MGMPSPVEHVSRARACMQSIGTIMCTPSRKSKRGQEAMRPGSIPEKHTRRGDSTCNQPGNQAATSRCMQGPSEGTTMGAMTQ